jgi:hypothetical protein
MADRAKKIFNGIK